MKAKIIKSILVPTSGILTVGVVSPILASSCGEQSIPVESIKINEAVDTDPIRLNVGGNVQLTATIYPADATNKNVTWSSNDESIATVDENGLVKAIRHYGTAIITATTKDGGKTATCRVIVNHSPSQFQHVESVQLNKSELDLAVGNTSQLTVAVLPETASNKEVTWSSSDENIATVDQNGLVKAVNSGNATITATTLDGGKTATCEVTVKPTAPITKSISVDKVELDQHNLDLVEGQTEQLTATILPEDATNKNVTWSSSDTSIVEVDQTGKVAAVKPGNATITATTQDGSKTATCMVEVTFDKRPFEVRPPKIDNDVLPIIHVQSINILFRSKFSGWIRPRKGVLYLEHHSTPEQLTATIYPEFATNKKVTWSSSDEKVATVDQTGLVKAVSKGTATITVTSEDSLVTDTITINVYSGSGTGGDIV